MSTASPSSEGPRPSSASLPKTVWLLGLTSLFTDVGSELIFPLLPGFLSAMGGATLVGAVEGFADATAALLKIPAGIWSDRMARKLPLVLTGYALAGAVRPLMALATAPWHAFAIRMGDRVGKGLRTAPRDALIADSVAGGQAGRAFGVHRAMDHAGAVVGPLLATALIAAGLAVTEVFALAVVPGVLAVVSLLFVREPVRERAEGELGERPSASASGAPLPPHFKRFLVVMVVFALAGSTDAFLLVRAGELGTPTMLIPLLWTALHIVKMVASALFGALADRVSGVRLIALGFFVYAAAYVALGLAEEPWQAWAITIAYGTWYGLAEPAEKALVRALAPSGARGRAFGWYHGATGLAAIPAGLLTGAVWELASPRAALWMDAAVALVAMGLLIGWARVGMPRHA